MRARPSTGRQGAADDQHPARGQVRDLRGRHHRHPPGGARGDPAVQVGRGGPLVALPGQRRPEQQVVAVAGAAEHHHGAGVVQDRRGVVLAPAGQQLRPGLERGADRHPAPAHVRGPGLQRDRGDQRGLVQDQPQRRVEPAAGPGDGQAAGLAGDVPGQRADQRGGLGLLGAEQEHRRPAAQQLLDVEPGARAAAAAAAAGWVSQPSAGITVEVIEVRVRSLVPTNCSTSLTNAATRERRSRAGTSWAARSGLATHDEHVATSSCRPSAAACSSAASTRRAWASQNSRSPDPPVRGGGEHVGGAFDRHHRVRAAGQRVERDRGADARRARRR